MNRDVLPTKRQVQGIFGNVRPGVTTAEIVSGKEIFNFLRSKSCNEKNILRKI
ncbi:hypothetical protein PEL8287_02126 [Roseovarius litorisediminis]|uniref:Uncharacterized protein n=1 Tax=Roseovarius litorisediminis TaxID=1312363 RepID=A0A1Y5SPZ7_9RHOB|nr:hypothetical protein PEL8287_02126 [Roseovarius litorisediminis]